MGPFLTYFLYFSGITSKPNKLIYFKVVTDEKMEMFATDECEWRRCVNSEEELIKIYTTKICKSPTESDGRYIKYFDEKKRSVLLNIK